MTKINSMEEFRMLTSSITSFSHAYLFNTNSLSNMFICAKEFAKKIILENYSDDDIDDISYQIDNNNCDDLYIVNPDTIGIKTEEIEKLFQIMATKSLRKNGNRVYIIYGFERLSQEVSNKILKFLEEPVDNLYGILLTENIDHILSTIISRCQVFNITFACESVKEENINNMIRFLEKIAQSGTKTIAYVNDYFENIYNNRQEMYDSFQIIENIFGNLIEQKYNTLKRKYTINIYNESAIGYLINMTEITNRFKMLIKQNINLNLLIDRYIIEMSKELDYAKNCRNNI